MAEYIDREAALMTLMQDGCSAKNLQSISDMPAVEAKPVVHAHWEPKKIMAKTPFARNYYCSNCKDEPLECKHICGNCGAQMDEKEDKHEDYT